MNDGQLDVETVAYAIEAPVSQWAGNCYAIACAMVREGLVKGIPRYGHWLGPVDPKCLFANRLIVSHGWVETGRESFGSKEVIYIADPTRFVFEGKKPYIWMGVDFEGYYDLGGNYLRAVLQRPVPVYDPKQRVDLAGSQEGLTFVENLLGSAFVDVARVCWLANLPLDSLGEAASEIYKMIVVAGFRAAIPLDNRKFVLGD